MAKKAKKMSEARRKALVAGQQRRRERERAEAGGTPAPSRKRAKRVMKNGRAPEGVHVLRRNGNGRDLIECNADEVLQALRDVRAARKIFCPT